jgi:hypothetical protein
VNFDHLKDDLIITSLAVIIALAEFLALNKFLQKVCGLSVSVYLGLTFRIIN